MKEIEKDFIGEIIKHEKYGYGMIKNFNIDTEIVVKGSCGAVKMTIEFNNKERDFIININNYSTIKFINKVKQEGLLQIMELISSFELPPVPPAPPAPPVEPPKTNTGTIYVYESNADFLNKNFGTTYKAWMRCTWEYDRETVVWMVHIDGSVHMGWSNTLSDNGNTIIERYVENPMYQIERHKRIRYNYRIVVDKSQNYKILGVYKIDWEQTRERTYRVWHKIRDFYIGKNR